MKRKFTFKTALSISTCLFFLFLLYTSTALAQTTSDESCGTTEHLNTLSQSDPTLQTRITNYEQQIQQWIADNPEDNTRSSRSVITIPVVIHIVYKNSSENISNNKCFDIIQALNEDFGRTNPDAHLTPAVWTSIAANTGIQFCLAQRTPAGTVTNGIERRHTTVQQFYHVNNKIKFSSTGGLDAWNVTKYLNIWVGDIDVSYGEFPTGTASNTFGLVCRYAFLGLGTWVATHEIGHCFNLRHIWADDGGTCGGSDYVSDTPNQANSTTTCPGPFPKTDACSPNYPGIMFMNYMDYTPGSCSGSCSGCDSRNLFTNGQKTRMNAVLNTSPYNALKTSNGCSPVGLPAPSPPTISSTNTCGDKTLTRGNPPSGTTYYWQGTSCGTSTANSSLNYTVSFSATYYLRAKNSSGTWSACSSTAVTINQIPGNPPAPSTTTNPCGNQTLTRGSPPSGETYYWQGTSCGTSTNSGSASTYAATVTGTYYLRARTSAGCWSNACSSVAVAVAPTPATPPVPSASTNSCGSVTLTMGNPPAGQTYYWQTSCGLDMTNSASTYIVNTSGNYYLRSLSSQGCWSACASIGVTVIDCPTNLSASIGPCPAATVSFSWINSGSSWTLQTSLDSAFSSFYSKSANNATLLTGPSGFSPAFLFQANATYYWRINTGNVYVDGPNFTTPFCDVIAPATAIASISGWQDSSFTANFTDADDSLGSGIGKRFYRVIDFNGTEWRANGLRGFANDNFDNNTLNADWTSHTGIWANSVGFLMQSDEAVNNTNLSTPLSQNLSDRYLYHWTAKIEGSGTNRRGGLHFFSDSASLPNRGNGYLMWFRIDNNKLQFYKVTNDVPALVKNKNYSFTAGQFYDFKLVVDRISGKMDIYINNILAESWQDASPITSGNYVSFRTGNAAMTVNYFKAFRSRLSSETINVGAGNTNDIRFENAGPFLSAAKVESIVTDSAGNLSALVSVPVNVDWTPPSAIAFINDGPGADISTTYDSTALTANWSPSTDPNSGIAKYHYSIGISPGDTSISGTTDNFIQLIATKSPLPLVVNQIYYFNIWSENAAGLLSTITSSNGQQVVLNVTGVEEISAVVGLNFYPNPFNNTATLDYTLLKSEKVQIGLYDLSGKKIAELKNESQGAGNHKIKIESTNLGLSNGLYLVVFKTETTSAFIKIDFNEKIIR